MTDQPGRAVIYLGHETLGRLLDLPPGMRVVAVSHDFARLGVLLGVEAEWLPVLEEGMTAREFDGAFNSEVTVDEEGRRWYRWDWGGPPRTDPV